MIFNNGGLVSQLGNVMHINNAIIQEVFVRSNTTGNILVSQDTNTLNHISAMNLLRLNINNNTVILNSSGKNICICDLHSGMVIDSIFSQAMTRSIPPQSNAFLIVVQRRSESLTNVTTDRIASIDRNSNSLYTGNPSNINSQTRFILTNSTPIRDSNGNPTRLSNLRPGQMVRILHANFQTASIPPQTTAYYVQLL